MTEVKRVPALSARTRTVQAWPVLELPPQVEEKTGVITPTPPPYAPVDTAQLPDLGETVGGHCVLRKLLGEGAFGRVFAAVHEETGQQVALKVVGLRRYPREYAEHELRALASIAHPNVVQLNEHGVEAGALEPYLWYTMPLYKGSDLASVLRAQGSLSLTRAHAVFARIAGGVSEMHNAGLRHQDIKPDNIYLATMAGVAEHHPVLLDLGGAARKDATRPLVATFPFAAPEQSEALIGGLLGDRHAPLTEKVDVYALAATLLYALIGHDLLGHDIGQSEADDTSTPAGLIKLRAQLAIIHSLRAEDPLPVGTLPHVTGAVREHLNNAFKRWLAIDPRARPTASEFVHELRVLLEWEVELTRQKAARQFRGTLLGIVGGLSFAACVGGLTGYQWHKRTMGAANRATSEAEKKAADAASQLSLAGSSLDKIVGDPSLDPVEKAKKIGAVVASLEAQTSGLLTANAQLQAEGKKAAELARLRAQQDRYEFESTLKKSQSERDNARQEQSLSDSARAQAEADRDQARRDKLTADGVRIRAEGERDRAFLDRTTADGARTKAEAERNQAEQDKAAAEVAKRRAEAERDHAQQDKSAAEAAAFERGVVAGTARANAQNPPSPTPPAAN